MYTLIKTYYEAHPTNGSSLKLMASFNLFFMISSVVYFGSFTMNMQVSALMKRWSGGPGEGTSAQSWTGQENNIEPKESYPKTTP